MSTPTNIQQVISELQQNHSEEKIAKMVYDQLVKDFYTAGIDFDIPQDSDYKNWSAEIAEILRKTADQKLAVLLYSVDIPEKMAVNINDTEAFASLILYREFVKIYFRLYYNL